MATSIVAALLFLQYSNSNKEISMYINSPGGSVTAGLSIYDTMQYIKPDIRTICVGQAASMGAILLAAGTEGRRLSLPHSRMMIHQPKGGYCGDQVDIEIQSEEIKRVRARLDNILAKHTGKPIDEITKATDRDNYMDVKEAIEYGLIDNVIERLEE